jgi:hypothetical protein
VTNHSGSFARLWVVRLVSTLFVCVGAIALAPAISPPHDAAASSPLSTGCGLAASASEHAALTGGALAPEAPDSTDNDDDDGDEELPAGSMVLPQLPVAAEPLAMEFIPHAGPPVVRTIVVDAHSLRAPPQ